MTRVLVSFCLLVATMSLSHAFQVSFPTKNVVDTVAWKTMAKRTTTAKTKTTTTQLDCICIDCARVTNCTAYHFVETKHEQPHMTEKPTFSPREGSPTIHVNVRTNRDQDVMSRMWKEHGEETKQAEQEAAAAANTNANDNKDDSAAAAADLHGNTVYDVSPVTTVEYDVVACEDFVEDKGCWVRNMPEEIKRANPDFVPT